MTTREDEDYLDIAGIAARDTRSEQKVTMISRPGGSWSHSEVDGLVTNLHTSVSRLKDYPSIVLIAGEYETRKLACILKDNFEQKIVLGLDNPELPFIPTFI